jgi:hypothetical protein
MVHLCRALRQPALGADVSLPTRVAVAIHGAPLHRVLNFLLRDRAALAVALPRASRRGRIVGIRPVRQVMVSPVGNSPTVHTRSLLVARTGSQLLPFTAVSADLALGLQQTVFQAHVPDPFRPADVEQVCPLLMLTATPLTHKGAGPHAHDSWQRPCYLTSSNRIPDTTGKPGQKTGESGSNVALVGIALIVLALGFDSE